MLQTEIPIQDVFDKMAEAERKQKGKIMFGNIGIRVSKPLKVFRNKGIKCDVCGIEATHFQFKKQKKSFDMSLTLHAKPLKGRQVSMTMDHVIPQCLGGSDGFDNLVTMCAPCNNIWKSKFDQQLKNSVLGVSEDAQHYLIIQKD